ncbi:hypothetical protein SAMN02745244_01664 [Tessaracoccus bendigoensis DSM 12906]|uniref:Uncharacterized protein n=2 Tax=Tessaracoccus TaxID=72763 RepID=A0A1M6GCV1_9ACTN|nr:hypothetical protein SAMN02745244_01664 [Tessaracoccus bendigoensis DSM 12906]
MTSRVPTWAMGLMGALLLVSIAVGLGSDAGVFFVPSFTLNLVSSVTAFTASGLFASALVNRFVRKRYWGVELNRRVAASARMELLTGDVAEFLQLDLDGEAIRDGKIYDSTAERAVARLRSAIELRQAEIGQTRPPDDELRVSKVSTTGENAPWVAHPGATLAEQLGFVSDAQLLHATDRLDVKLDEFRTAFNAWRESGSVADYSSLLRTGQTVTSAISANIEWLVAAPGKTMSAMVREGLRDSEGAQRP